MAYRNLIRESRQRKLAARQGAGDPVFDTKAASLYELMLMQLAEHRRRLKQIQSIEQKAEVKRKLLPEYQPYIDGVLQSGAGRQDDVLMTVMLWHIDAGNVPEALRLADYAIAHGLQTPDRYERTTATLLAEEVADIALRRIESDPVPAEWLELTEQLTADQDMYDQVRAKLHKALGAALEREDRLAEAAAHYRRALELDERSGVKKWLEKVERELKNQEAKNNPGQAQPAG